MAGVTTHAERRRAEAARRAHERLLRPGPALERDRDPGLETAWRRRLAGSALSAAGDRIVLAADGRYRRADDEAGAWAVRSNVGRASLMLYPRDGIRYGYILTRGARVVALNGRPYRAAPAAAAASVSIAPIRAASSGVSRA